MSTLVFGIKNCDTIKKARRWLESHAIHYEFCDMREQPPSPQMVSNWIDKIGIDTLVNRRSTTYRQLPTEQQQSTDKGAWLKVIAQQPTLIKRPLLAHEGQLYCGFNEKQYKDIFNV